MAVRGRCIADRDTEALIDELYRLGRTIDKQNSLLYLIFAVMLKHVDADADAVDWVKELDKTKRIRDLFL